MNIDIGLNQYAEKRVLVTGGSGFIGSMLCAHLAAYGANFTSFQEGNNRLTTLSHGGRAIYRTWSL